MKFLYTTPEECGIPSGNITSFLDKLSQKELPLHSLIIMRHGKICYENYWAPITATTNHRMFSIAKSVVAIAVGLMADEGLIKLSDKIYTYFPEYASEETHPYIKEATIRDLLMMRSCHATTTYKACLTGNWVESYFTTKPSHRPGTIFHYDTSAPHVLCALCEKLTGYPLLNYIKKKLSPLELSDRSFMLTDPQGVSQGGSGYLATSMDIFKLGYFLYNKGNIDGKQLLSKEYCEAMCSKLTDTYVTGPIPSEQMGYGYYVWQNEIGGFVLYGMGGQLVISIPQYDILVTTTADTQGMAGGNQIIYDALYSILLAGISDNPISPIEGDVAHLKNISENASIICVPNNHPVTAFSNISGTKYLCQDDDIFESVTLLIEGARGSILLNKKNGTEITLPFGFGTLEKFTFPEYDQFSCGSGGVLSDGSLYVRFHVLDEYCGSVRFQFYTDGTSLTVYMRKVEESLFSEYNRHLNCIA